MTLEGRFALITGGTKGIGRRTAELLADQGCNVAVNYFRSRDTADEVVEMLKGKGVRSFAVRGNVGKPEHIEKIFAAVKEEFGALDFFISNAAVGALKPVLELDVDDWEKTMNINARALMLGAQQAVPLMEGRDARIIGLTSLGPVRTIPDYAAVAASKAAIEVLIRYLAVELAPKGINANAVAGGVVDTASLQAFPAYEQIISHCRESTPAGRPGQPEDIAPIVAWLCSPEAHWIRGQILIADGGYMITG
jgi:enoyl-[acyl-carrier protein] reductase III